MSSIKHLKLVANAGDPDDVISLRIDLIQAAVGWYNAHYVDDNDDEAGLERMEAAEGYLADTVERYKQALKRRR